MLFALSSKDPHNFKTYLYNIRNFLPYLMWDITFFYINAWHFALSIHNFDNFFHIHIIKEKDLEQRDLNSNPSNFKIV